MLALNCHMQRRGAIAASRPQGSFLDWTQILDEEQYVVCVEIMYMCLHGHMSCSRRHPAHGLWTSCAQQGWLQAMGKLDPIKVRIIDKVGEACLGSCQVLRFNLCFGMYPFLTWGSYSPEPYTTPYVRKPVKSHPVLAINRNTLAVVHTSVQVCLHDHDDEGPLNPKHSASTESGRSLAWQVDGSPGIHFAL